MRVVQSGVVVLLALAPCGAFRSPASNRRVEKVSSLKFRSMKAIYRQSAPKAAPVMSIEEPPVPLMVDEPKPAPPDLKALALKITETDARLKALDREAQRVAYATEKLKRERDEDISLYDRIRFEVKSNAFLNGPILTALFTTAALALLWRDITVIITLFEYNEFMEAEAVPEAIKLLSRLPMDTFMGYGVAVASAPIFTKACTSGVSYMLGDMAAQLVEGRYQAEFLDLKRVARNAALGFFLHGPALHFWLMGLEGPGQAIFVGDTMNMDPAGIPLVLLKIALDQTIFACFINICYSTFDGLLANMNLSAALERASQKLVPSILASWRFWPIVNLLTYSTFIPLDFKLLFIDIMEVLWVVILSTTVNSVNIANEDKPNFRPMSIPWGEGVFFDPEELREDGDLLLRRLFDAPDIVTPPKILTSGTTSLYGPVPGKQDAALDTSYHVEDRPAEPGNYYEVSLEALAETQGEAVSDTQG